MLHSRFRQFGAITRAEAQPDGSVMVFGIASSGNMDAEGETILPRAIQAALPDYSRHPTLREMHQPSAAGRVTEAQVDEDGMTRIAAHVVDPVAVSKVKAGVYSGFSVGGKVLRRCPGDPSVIEAIRLVEISLVDSPCNPDATLNMWKADMRTYSPTNDDVIAEARRLATDAGSARYKDFLYKASQSLIARAGNDDDAPEPPTADAPPAPQNKGHEPAAEEDDFSDKLTALLAQADPEQIQQAHDMLAELGAHCGQDDADQDSPAAPPPTRRRRNWRRRSHGLPWRWPKHPPAWPSSPSYAPPMPSSRSVWPRWRPIPPPPRPPASARSPRARIRAAKLTAPSLPTSSKST